MVLKQHPKGEASIWGWIINTEREVLFFHNFSIYIYSIGKSHRKKPEEKKPNYWLWAPRLIATLGALLTASNQQWVRGYPAPDRRKGWAKLHARTVTAAFWRGQLSHASHCRHSYRTRSLPQAPHPVACPGLTSAQSFVVIENTQNS